MNALTWVPSVLFWRDFYFATLGDHREPLIESGKLHQYECIFTPCFDILKTHFFESRHAFGSPVF